MKNSIIIILYKLLEAEIFLEDFYGKFAHSDFVKNIYALKNTAIILTDVENKHAQVFKRLIEETESKKTVILDENIMAEVDYILVNLKQSMNSYGITTAGQLIAKAVDNENKHIFLMSHIIKLLKKETSVSYIKELFVFLLEEEQRHLANLRPFLSDRKLPPVR